METLNSTIKTMSQVVKLRLAEYVHPNGNNIEEIIFSILTGASRVKKNELIDIVEIKNAISYAVVHEEPIKISLLWTIGAHARSPFKILDWQSNVPRLGDIWALYWFRYLDQKIKIVYSPGIHVVLIDEVPLSRLMGWSEADMNIRKKIFCEFIPKDLKVTVLDMPNFPESKSYVLVSPGEILMVLTSSEIISPELQIMISNDLYIKHDKSWEEIKNAVGLNKWKEAEDVVIKMSKIKLSRKEIGWVAKSVFENHPYIDGCILKKGRWSPNIWDSTSPQHGGALLSSDGIKKFSTKIVPEFRLKNDEQIPCIISIEEYQQFIDEPIPWKGEVVLYWR